MVSSSELDNGYPGSVRTSQQHRVHVRTTSMALPPCRASVLLLVALALAATMVFSSADAVPAPAALEAAQEAAAADGAQAQAPTGSDDAMPVEHVVVVDKRGGGGGGGRGGGGGGVHGGGGGEGGGSVGGSRGWGFGGAGYHGHGHKSAASSGRDGAWKVGVAASVLGAAAWLL